MHFHTIAIRIGSSFLQVSSLLQNFRVTIPEAVQQLFAVQGSSSAISEQILAFDCIQRSQRGLQNFSIKQGIAMMLPILAIPFVYAFWILRSRIRKESFKDKFFATVVILYYIMFPSIVNRVAVTFACISVGDGSDHRRLMQEAMDTECYSVHHILVIFLIALPALCSTSPSSRFLPFAGSHICGRAASSLPSMKITIQNAPFDGRSFTQGTSLSLPTGSL